MSNPFDWIGTHTLGLPKWAGIVFGLLFIFMGIALMMYFYPRTKRNAKLYKVAQLEEWRKLNPKRTLAKYKDTGMYLPPWEKAKMSAPTIFFVLLCFVGTALIIGNTLSSL